MMILKKTRVLSVCLATLFLIGCIPATTNLKGKLFERKVEVASFEKQANQNFRIEVNVQAVSVQVDSLPSIVQLQIPVSHDEKIILLKLKETEYLNIDRHLLTGGASSDYIIDEKKNLLLVNFDLPLLYFLKGPLRYELSMLLSDVDARTDANIQTILVTFNWVPRRSVENGKSGFDYYPSLIESKGKDKKQYGKQIQKELEKTHSSRLNPFYLSELEIFSNKR